MYIYNLLYCIVYYIAHEERIIYLVEYLTGRYSALEKQYGTVFLRLFLHYEGNAEAKNGYVVVKRNIYKEIEQP
jgi:hypothetical protein